MTRSQCLVCLLAAGVIWSVSSGARADDEFVTGAKLLTARDFDDTLPGQPIEEWLRVHLPGYQTVWGEHITDCGEGTGRAVDKERDMPQCAEIEIRDRSRAAGYLLLLVGTQTRGLLNDGLGLYFGYLEHRGTKYDFKRLSDVLKVK
jgi:hypothetical protein